MQSRKIVLIIFALFVVGLILPACASSKPSVVISSPPSGSTFHEGDDVAVQSTSADAGGIIRVELAIDGAVVHSGTPPAPQANFSIVQVWKATAGAHTVMVRAYNAAGTASDPAAISIVVSEAAAAPANAPTSVPTTAAIQPPTAVPPTAVPPTSTACSNNAAYVADVTVPDGTQFAPGQSFNKVWRLRNTGTCTWTSAYDFAFVTGEAMATTTTIAVPATAPGATADLLVAMTAPTALGNHVGQWKMRNAGDTFFGGAVTVKINVVDANAPSAQPPAQQPAQPPATGCSGSPTVGAFTASPDSFSFTGGDTTLSWDAVSNADSVEIDNGIGGVGTPGNRTVHVDSTTTFTLSAHCGSNTVTAQAKVTVNKLLQIQPGLQFQLIFKVTGATASKNTYVCDSHGTATVKFNGTITTNGTGDVTYRWEDSNSGGGSTQTLHFNSATTLGVPQYQTSISWTGQKWIHVLTPTDLTSNKVNYGCPYTP